MAHDPFKIRDHVPAFDAIVAEIRERSDRTRRTLRCRLDVPYGEARDDRLDLFFPDGFVPDGGSGTRPVHLFVHGGYWRMFSKNDYAYVADTITHAGAIAAIVDYSLMPAVRMQVLVDQVWRARRWLLDHAREFGGSASDLTASGHSAGAHLTTFLCTEGRSDAPGKVLLLGGLYDLKPLQTSFLQQEIALTDEEAARFAPMNRRFSRSTSMTLLVGALETPPFHRQAEQFVSRLGAQGVASSLRRLDGADHMSSVRDLGIPGSEAGTAMAALIQRTP